MGEFEGGRALLTTILAVSFGPPQPRLFQYRSVRSAPDPRPRCRLTVFEVGKGQGRLHPIFGIVHWRVSRALLLYRACRLTLDDRGVGLPGGESATGRYASASCLGYARKHIIHVHSDRALRWTGFLGRKEDFGFVYLDFGHSADITRCTVASFFAAGTTVRAGWCT